MHFERLAIEAGDDTFTLDFHERLTVIAGMGQLLSDPKYLGDWGWDQAIALANDARGNDPFGYRAEAVRLMRLAQSLSR